MITPNPRCDCCGFPTQSLAADDCPHCGYPIDPAKEEQFLRASLYDLQRMITYNGIGITVAQLITRYQQRLFYLYKLRSIASSVPPVSPSAQPVQKVKNVDLAGTTAHEQTSPEALAKVGAQPLSTGDVSPVLATSSRLAADSRSLALSTGINAPITPLRPGNDRGFSLKSFLADQTINIIASLGAFLILLGSLSFIITTSNLLLSFIVMLIVHSLFGVSGAISYRFRSFRVVAVIYTAIFALQVPLVGFAAYRLIPGHLIQLTVPTLVVITAAYAAVAYAWLAIYQKFELFAYLYVISLAIVDLAVCSSIHLEYWWWPGMLMLLALLSLISEAHVSYFPPSLAALNRPVRLLMFTCVGVCASGALITTLYSLGIDTYGQPNLEMRFAVVYMLVLLLCWNVLFVWFTRHKGFASLFPYLFFSCVVACSYAFAFDQIGYALAFTVVALLYHGLKRFASQLLWSFLDLAGHIEWIALVLIALVPWIVSPVLPVQIFTYAYQPSLLNFQVTGATVVALIILLVGLVLTFSIIESHTGLRKVPVATQSFWCWLLLLSGFILGWTYGIAILSLHADPAWCFLSSTLILMTLTVAVRRFVSVVWADPLDVLALFSLGLTLLLSLNHGTEYIVVLLLGFAVLSYAIVLYQRRQDALFLPLIFGVLACQPLLSLPRVLLVLSVLLPLVLAGAYLLVSRYWRTDEVQSQQFGMAFWVWPLLVIGPLYGIALFWHDISTPMSTMQSWLGVPFPVALEVAALALAWYISAVLARVRVWLFIMMGFAVLALLSASEMFWWLVAVAPLLTILALGISRLAGRTWALPLYGLAILAGVIMGKTGYSQENLVAAVWALLGFALLVYLVGVAERTPIMMRVLIWAAAFFACWSVYYSGVRGDYLFPPLVALACAAIGVGIGLFRFVAHPFFILAQRHKLLLYALPWYATAIFAAILTGVYGVLFGVNKPFYGAVPITLLVYALVAYGVLLLERKTTWLWLVACFSLWGIFLFPQTYSCALPLSTTHFSFICGAPIYSLATVVLASGLLGMLCGRLSKGSLEHARRLTMLRTKYAWSWPWYLTSLVAIGVTIRWNTNVGSILPQDIWLSILGIFILLWLTIMLVERMPESLLVVAMLAAYTIAQTSWPIWQVMGGYSLLCVCLFALQFIWYALPPKVYVLSAESLHRLVTMGGLVIVVLGIILQGGLLPHAGMLAHVGTSSLCLLSVSLIWYGHIGRLQPLPVKPAVQRLCYYGAGLLPFLVISWEWLAFGQTDLSLLSIAPATYLIVCSPFLSRDTVLPQRERLSGLCAISGAIMLLLPTLWSSFSQQNLFPALLLAGEALLLCLLGIGMRVRFFVLSGAALVIVSGIHILFLPSFGIPNFLALTISGGLLLICATGLMLIRPRFTSGVSEYR